MKLAWPRNPGEGAWMIPAAYAGLCLFSLATLWSVTEGIHGPYEIMDPGVPKSIFWRQVIWVAIGWSVLLTVRNLPLPWIEEASPFFYLLCVILLAIVLVAAPVVQGARRWFDLGPVRLQPSEPAKIAVILILARLLAAFHAQEKRLLPVVGSLLLAGLPLLLIMREPDLGTSLVFAAIWIVVVFWYGLSWVLLLSLASPLLSAVFSFYAETVAGSPWPWAIYLLVLLAALTRARFRLLENLGLMAANLVTGLVTTFFWEGLHTYQQERILTFFDPARDQFGSGYQAIQSKVAIGSGGLFGTSYLQGTQKGLAFLPERHTDFIFSVVGEELGFIGAMLLVGLYLVIILRGLQIALEARRPFSSLLAVGVVTYFTFHVVVNICITTGLLPVTGLPLPVMSYGGSNMLTSAIMLGLLTNVGSRSFET
ncbi:MAG: rod shape-determining protein RodA [bacterium]|nr:rod shape-determining protein RodA [bacterium]